MKLAGSTCALEALHNALYKFKTYLLTPGAPTLCGHLLWRFAIQRQSTVPQSSHALCTQVRSMCSWALLWASSLVPSIIHPSHGFQCSSALKCQPYEEGCHWQAGGENRQTWQLANPAWYVPSPPLLRLTSRKPLWLDLQLKSRWRHNWKSAQVVSSHL